MKLNSYIFYNDSEKAWLNYLKDEQHVNLFLISVKKKDDLHKEQSFTNKNFKFRGGLVEFFSIKENFDYFSEFDNYSWKEYSDFSFSKFVKRSNFSLFEIRLKSLVLNLKPGWIEEKWPKYNFLNLMKDFIEDEKVEFLVKNRYYSIFYHPTSFCSVYTGREFRPIVHDRRSNLLSDNIDLVGSDYYTNIIKQDDYLNGSDNFIFVGRSKFGQFCFTKKTGSKIHILKKKKSKKQ